MKTKLKKSKKRQISPKKFKKRKSFKKNYYTHKYWTKINIISDSNLSSIVRKKLFCLPECLKKIEKTR